MTKQNLGWCEFEVQLDQDYDFAHTMYRSPSSRDYRHAAKHFCGRQPPSAPCTWHTHGAHQQLSDNKVCKVLGRLEELYPLVRSSLLPVFYPAGFKAPASQVEFWNKLNFVAPRPSRL